MPQMLHIFSIHFLKDMNYSHRQFYGFGIRVLCQPQTCEIPQESRNRDEAGMPGSFLTVPIGNITTHQ